MSESDVLVIERDVITGALPFTPIGGTGAFTSMGSVYRWVPRPLAERSQTLVQAIPAAILRDGNGNYLVLQRIGEGRQSLRSRLSLVVGGHVEPMPHETGGAHAWKFDDLLRATLARELREELTLDLDQGRAEALGMIVDPRSHDASRHVAFIYRCDLSPADEVRVRAPDEFLKDSAFSAQMWPPPKLRRLLPSLDPWSAILVRSGRLSAA